MGARVVPEAVERASDGSVSGEHVEYKIRAAHVENPTVVLDALKALVADTRLRVDRSCGFHVHVGLKGNPATGRVWASWMVTLARYIEETAFQAVPESRRNNSYCRRYGTPSAFRGGVHSRQYYADKYSNGDMRYYWVNVVEMFRPNGIRTVEIRLLGNTRRFTYLLGWVSAVQIMAASAWRLTLDPSAMELEIENVKSAFTKIREGILPNSTADQCAATANLLASLAGFSVRASETIAAQNASTRVSPPLDQTQTESINPYMRDEIERTRRSIEQLGGIPTPRRSNVDDVGYLRLVISQRDSLRARMAQNLRSAAQIAERASVPPAPETPRSGQNEAVSVESNNSSQTQNSGLRRLSCAD